MNKSDIKAVKKSIMSRTKSLYHHFTTSELYSENYIFLANSIRLLSFKILLLLRMKFKYVIRVPKRQKMSGILIPDDKI